VGFFGEKAGSVIDGSFGGGTQRYTFKPLSPDDWGTCCEPATTKRTLDGFISRSFIIPALEGDSSAKSGLFFKRNEDGSQTVVVGAENLYDFTAADHPEFRNLGNVPIPDVLADLETIEGNPLKASDFIYKADTSTDEIIAHMFIYKVAFDILN
jgi:hypothetical protein